MLKRAEKHADAVVVPLHAMADELAGRTKLGDRIRVIAGAAPVGFAEPRDAVGRRRTLAVPEGAVVVDGTGVSAAALGELIAALGREVPEAPVVVLDAPSDADSSPGSVVSLSALDAADRAAALASASVVLAPRITPAYGWRTLEALVLGTPIVVAESAVNRELVGDGGIVVDGGAEAIAVAVAALQASDTDHTRAATLAADRGRGFSWREAGDRVWQLHADL
jgi:glycosyltransferase involved in cell wall biosynthesis